MGMGKPGTEGQSLLRLVVSPDRKRAVEMIMARQPRKTRTDTIEMNFDVALGQFAQTRPADLVPATDQGPVRLEEDDTGARFLIYVTDKGVRHELRFDGDQPWFTQKQLAAMFGVTAQDVSQHIQAFVGAGELPASTIKDFLIVRREGERDVRRSIARYSLDVAFCVRYRVNLDGEVVGQRAKDGCVNATAMCKAAGKLWGHYHENKTTKQFLVELERSIGIPMDLIVQPITTGANDLRGTWVHPHVAIHLAQWLSPSFAVQVSQFVYEWMTRGAPRAEPELPFHLRRYVLNYPNVPVGHFSVLTEMTMTLIAPLEIDGYTLPERLWPDISEGRMFAGWLRDEHAIDAKDLPSYHHEFEDGRRAVPARAYPEHLLPAFRHHMRTVWLPHHSVAYFEPRDPAALPHLQKLILAQSHERLRSGAVE